jgi:hypothetical protein
MISSLYNILDGQALRSFPVVPSLCSSFLFTLIFYPISITTAFLAY